MRLLIQRVINASVSVNYVVVGSIQKGILALMGVTHTDTEKKADYLLEKLVNLRIFPDAADKMNLSLVDYGGEMLIVSQFTLYGDCRRGRRPSFTDSAPPEQAKKLYEYFILQSQKTLSGKIATGEFGAVMQIQLINDGPVTFMLES